MEKVNPKFMPERDTAEMKGNAWKGYKSGARTCLAIETFTNEVNREINRAATDILRRTSCDSEVAFQRGRISGLENLMRRLNELAMK